MVFWETVTEKEEVRFRDWGILQGLLCGSPYSQSSSAGKYLPFDLHQSEKRESTAEESTDSEGNRKFNLYENTVKGKPLERVGRKAMGPKAR